MGAIGGTGGSRSGLGMAPEIRPKPQSTAEKISLVTIAPIGGKGGGRGERLPHGGMWPMARMGAIGEAGDNRGGS